MKKQGNYSPFLFEKTLIRAYLAFMNLLNAGMPPDGGT
jgi:hypothetical protein